MSRSKTPKIPESMMILGHEFKVTNDPDLDVLGETKGYQKTIRINLPKHENQAQVEHTLLHEVIHAILHISGLTHILRTEGQDDEPDRDEEEAVVQALEHGLGPLYQRVD